MYNMKTVYEISTSMNMVKILKYLWVPLYMFCSTYGYLCICSGVPTGTFVQVKCSIVPTGTSLSEIQVHVL